MDLNSQDLPLPRLVKSSGVEETTWVEAYTDLKLHDISDDSEKVSNRLK